MMGLDGATSQLHADTSLASLLFTDSSMDGLSLEQVVQQIDRNMTELSTSTEACDGSGEAKHSTPQQSRCSLERASGRQRGGGCNGEEGLDKSEGVLELVGREVKPQVRSGVRAWSHRVPTAPAATKAKRRVRNYNNKDL